MLSRRHARLHQSSVDSKIWDVDHIRGEVSEMIYAKTSLSFRSIESHAGGRRLYGLPQCGLWELGAVFELLMSDSLVLATVIFHGSGLLVLGRLLRFIDRGDEAGLNPLSWSGMAYTSIVALGLLVLAGIEIWFYALMFLVLGAVPALREAVRSGFPMLQSTRPGSWSEQSRGLMAFCCLAGPSRFS